jgi:hypothetical protein
MWRRRGYGIYMLEDVREREDAHSGQLLRDVYHLLMQIYRVISIDFRQPLVSLFVSAVLFCVCKEPDTFQTSSPNGRRFCLMQVESKRCCPRAGE